MENGLIIFVRTPALGKVKTRLAATLGDEKALEIYKELLQHTKEITQLVHADKHVFYFNEIALEDLWSDKGFSKKVQINDDLGGKMKNAFDELFNEGYKKVIIIGSDCFELNTEIIDDAFHLLDKNDMVIGPAKDGGYYLLGMKQKHPFIFENKKWSTETVFKDTITAISNNQLTVAVLPQLTDVDTEEDWLKSKKIKHDFRN